MVEAADWLMTNSSLYKDEGISFNPQWVNQYNEEIVLHEDGYYGKLYCIHK